MLGVPSPGAGAAWDTALRTWGGVCLWGSPAIVSPKASAALLAQVRGQTRDPRCWDATIHLLPFIFTLEDKKQTHSQLLRAGKLIPPLQGDFCLHCPRLLFHRQGNLN